MAGVATRGRRALAIGVTALCALPLHARAQESCTWTLRLPYTGRIPLEPVGGASGVSVVDAFPALTFQQPLFVTAPPDGTNRLFVVEKQGRIRVFPNTPAATSAPVFLDLTPIVASDGEGGLLGLAFDPGYASNGRFYVSLSTTCPAPCRKILRYTVSADSARADPASGVELLRWDRPFSNHNGGMLAFGPDGYLYASTGDGGSGGDPFNNGQNTATLLGKILRIDPSRGATYAIPPDNPFVGQPGRAPEVFHYGLRNPWRFSFDRLTGDLWIGDVGQNAREEVDFLPAGTPGGRNFGWSVCEGSIPYAGRNCAALGAVPPIFDYANPLFGRSVTGGYVYRGTRVPALRGIYVFAEYQSSYVSTFDRATGRIAPILNLANVASFGEDAQGELYAVSLTLGKLFAFQSGASGSAPFPAKLSQTGVFADTANLIEGFGVMAFDVVSPLWSDGATKRRWIGIPGQGLLRPHPTGAWDFPVGTTTVKHFELPIGGGRTRRVETRIFVRQRNDWAGYTYRWNEAQTDADLVTAPLSEDLTVDRGNGPEIQRWNYPGPNDCLGCHNLAAGRVLGFRTRQLNRDHAYPFGVENQLHVLDCMELFEGKLGDPARLGVLVDPADASETRTARARSYLEANCANCHQPFGPAPGSLDLRHDTLLGDMNVVNVVATDSLVRFFAGVRVVPRNSFQSLLWQLQRLEPEAEIYRMPRGSRLADPLAVDLFARWIDADVAVPSDLDSDGDGVRDAADNCPRTANADQARSAASGPGNACLCGDVDQSGVVDMADAGRIRSFIDGNASALDNAGHRRCARADSQLGFCSAVDAQLIEEGRAVPQECAVARELEAAAAGGQ